MIVMGQLPLPKCRNALRQQSKINTNYYVNAALNQTYVKLYISNMILLSEVHA